MADTSQIGVDKNKEAAGSVSCLLWICTGIYYFATTPQAQFVSWPAFVYFVGGGLLSALLLGATTYCLLEAHRRYIYRAPTLVRRVSFYDLFGASLNVALNILQFVAPVIAARYAFLWFFEIE